MGQTSIPCTTSVRDELDDMKPEKWSWSEFLQTLIDTSGEFDGRLTAKKADIEPLKEKIGRIESSSETIEQRTGRIERQLEDLEGRR